ncbi:hypothetical protein BCR44DRAFT_1497881 [Catenaria anguillulae PL171]|uniref:Leucine-rich repeat-containing N-terminal plant-type domain-containing protein n=1 Tax=Catenaria anguillulae PL171 TaxID=765915 RepID=A0A1Y2HXL4_9FUNG|nr:hypothetical protein BCR44DRAFT_1497881 [Catenaria anguillulae PL171]
MSATPQPTLPGPTPAECNAALDLYLATGGPTSWRVKTGYRNAVRDSRECCGWYGISCSPNGNIFTLNLMSNGLQGSLPSGDVLAGLQFVENVFMQGNSLIGSLAPLAKLPALKEISVRKNALAGELAGELGQLKYLSRLSASENFISSVSPNLAKAPIVTLFLGNNSLTSFPPEVASSPTLRLLHLNNNKFTSIPASLSQFKGDQCSLVSDPRSIPAVSTNPPSNSSLCAPIDMPPTSTCLNMYYNDQEVGAAWIPTKLTFPSCPVITPSPSANDASGGGMSTGATIAITLVILAMAAALAMVGIRHYRRKRAGNANSGRGLSLSRAGMMGGGGGAGASHTRKSGHFGATSAHSATTTLGGRSAHVTSDTGASTIVVVDEDPSSSTSVGGGGGANLTAATLDEDDEFDLGHARAVLDDNPTRSRRWSLPLNLPHLLKRSGSNGSHHKKSAAVLFRPQGVAAAVSGAGAATTTSSGQGASAANRMSVVGTAGGLFHPAGITHPSSSNANTGAPAASAANSGVRPFTANASTAPISSPLLNNPEALGGNLPKAHARLLAHSRQRDDSALRLPSPQIALVSAPTTRALGPISWGSDNGHEDALPPGVLALPPLVDSTTGSVQPATAATAAAAAAAGEGSSTRPPESVPMTNLHSDSSAPTSARARCVSFALPPEDSANPIPSLSLNGEPMPTPPQGLATPGSVLLGSNAGPALLVTPATPIPPLPADVVTPGVVDGVALVPAPSVVAIHGHETEAEASAVSVASSGGSSRLSRANTAPAAMLSSRFAGKYRGSESTAAAAGAAAQEGDKSAAIGEQQAQQQQQQPVPAIHFLSPSTLLGT